MTAINSVISFAGIPALPFGGIGDSGFGRIHGADGLQGVHLRQGGRPAADEAAVALTTFSRTEKAEKTFATLITVLHGRASQLPKRPRRQRRTG